MIYSISYAKWNWQTSVLLCTDSLYMYVILGLVFSYDILTSLYLIFSHVLFCRWTTSICSSFFIFSSVELTSLKPHESQHARPPCPSPTPRVYPNSCPSSQWCHPAVSSSVIPFSPAPNPSPHQGLFHPRVNSWHEVAKVLEFQLQHQSFQWTPRTDLF